MESVSEGNGFTFIWKIHNFSYCTQKNGEYLRSPTFAMNNCKWNVNLFPRGTSETPDNIRITLWRKTAKVALKLSLVFSFSTASGPIESSGIREFPYPISQQGLMTYYKFDKVPVIHKSGSWYCNANPLIFKCKILNIDGIPINHQSTCEAYTIIGVKKTNYNWNVKRLSNFKKKSLDSKELNLFEIPSFTIVVSSLKGYSDEEIFEVVIKRAEVSERIFSTCTMSLLDTEKVIQSVRNEHWFEKPEIDQVWTVSFTPTIKLISCPQQDKFLRFEFAVSKGVESSGIDQIAYGTIIEPKSSANQQVICTKPVTEGSMSWKDNLQRFYSDGTLSDVTIQTPTKEYPAHKAMLCAQSAVFTAMFERDMKEQQTGIIDIDDLKDETISKMLLYIYGGSVENLDWGLALNLYFAADKYKIEALREQCSNFFNENLSSDNVCECLIHADLHQDQRLKSVAQNFIKEHTSVVINSEEWKSIMKVNPILAAETLHFCLNN